MKNEGTTVRTSTLNETGCVTFIFTSYSVNWSSKFCITYMIVTRKKRDNIIIEQGLPLTKKSDLKVDFFDVRRVDVH